MCHVTGVKNKDSPSIITVLTEIIRSRRFSVTLTVEMRSIVEIRKHPHSGNEGFGIKNPAQGFHSIPNNRASVCSEIKVSRRRETLSFRHHAEVCVLIKRPTIPNIFG